MRIFFPKLIMALGGVPSNKNNTTFTCPLHPSFKYSFKLDNITDTISCSDCGFAGDMLDLVSAYYNVKREQAEEYFKPGGLLYSVGMPDYASATYNNDRDGQAQIRNYAIRCHEALFDSLNKGVRLELESMGVLQRPNNTIPLSFGLLVNNNVPADIKPLLESFGNEPVICFFYIYDGSMTGISARRLNRINTAEWYPIDTNFSGVYLDENVSSGASLFLLNDELFTTKLYGKFKLITNKLPSFVSMKDSNKPYTHTLFKRTVFLDSADHPLSPQFLIQYFNLESYRTNKVVSIACNLLDQHPSSMRNTLNNQMPALMWFENKIKESIETGTVGELMYNIKASSKYELFKTNLKKLSKDKGVLSFMALLDKFDSLTPQKIPLYSSNDIRKLPNGIYQVNTPGKGFKNIVDYSVTIHKLLFGIDNNKHVYASVNLPDEHLTAYDYLPESCFKNPQALTARVNRVLAKYGKSGSSLDKASATEWKAITEHMKTGISQEIESTTLGLVDGVLHLPEISINSKNNCVARQYKYPTLTKDVRSMYVGIDNYSTKSYASWSNLLNYPKDYIDKVLGTSILYILWCLFKDENTHLCLLSGTKQARIAFRALRFILAGTEGVYTAGDDTSSLYRLGKLPAIIKFPIIKTGFMVEDILSFGSLNTITYARGGRNPPSASNLFIMIDPGLGDTADKDYNRLQRLRSELTAFLMDALKCVSQSGNKLSDFISFSESVCHGIGISLPAELREFVVAS